MTRYAAIPSAATIAITVVDVKNLFLVAAGGEAAGEARGVVLAASAMVEVVSLILFWLLSSVPP